MSLISIRDCRINDRRCRRSSMASRVYRPCFSAFRAERALPSSVFGPRDLAPFFRLAAARAGMRAASDAAPALDMAFLAGKGMRAHGPGRRAYTIIGILSSTGAAPALGGRTEALFGSGAVAYCQQMFAAAQPIQAWLVATLGGDATIVTPRTSP